jgi:hypothetical protein
LTDGTASGKVIDNFKKILAGAGHKELGDFHLETVLSRCYLDSLIKLQMKEAYFCGHAGLKRISFAKQLTKTE